MKFLDLYKLYTLLESPNSIIDPKTGDNIFYYSNRQSWSGYLIDDSGTDYDKFILHSDIHGVAGHVYLNLIIKDGSDPEDKYHKWFKRLRTNIPEDNIRELFLNKHAVQFRLWPVEKVCSFWKKWNTNYIVGIENVLKNMNQNPEDYTFEFNGATANDPRLGYACYNYRGLLSGTKNKTYEDTQAERREEEWEEDKKLLSQIQMGMKPTLNNKPRSIFNQGEGD